MRRTLGLSVALLLTLSLVAAGGNTAVAASTLWVNDNDPNLGSYLPPGSSCDDPGFQTIQSAVNAAVAGDTINVCPGTYAEQIVIFGTDKNNVRLRSVAVWQAVIRAPAVLAPDGPALAKTILRVDQAQNVQILGFTITGPGPGPCDSLQFGVKVHGGGSADILGNHITHIRDDPLSGCQNGVAVQVGNTFEATVGSARIVGNVIDDYNKNGITVDDAPSHAEIAYNRIIGAGPTMVTAQNGIQVSRGATANVRDNFVSGNDYTGSSEVASGILLFEPGVVTVDSNTVNSNGVGIFDSTFVDDGLGAGTEIRKNRVRASRFDGIVLQNISDRLVQTNKSSDNAGPGISLYRASSIRIVSNWATKNGDTGILLDSTGPTFGSNGNSVTANIVSFNGTAGIVPDTTDGIRINADSTGNVIANNRLKKNITHDCHDGSTGNTWMNNGAQSSFPVDLCGEAADADSAADESQFGWDPSHSWNAEFGVPADVDFTAAYATVDIDGLLTQLPALPTGRGLKRAAPSD
jgi:nitrous oxidase accessory protein NosD